MYVCFFGDSLTLGTRDPAFRGWPGRVCEKAAARGVEVNAMNLGIRGNTSDAVAERWVDESRRRIPEGEELRLVFSFGAADTTRGVDQEASIKNARRILTVASQAHEVVFVGPPPVADATISARIKGLSAMFAGVCTDLAVAFLDVYTPLSDASAYLAELDTGDGVHPGEAGYVMIAELVDAFEPWRRLVGG